MPNSYKDERMDVDVVDLGQSTLQLACVYIGPMLCGFDIQHVQEIRKFTEVTEVPSSPAHICGIMNLRGQIVTVIDLGVKLDLFLEQEHQKQIVIVNWNQEYIGLLVDEIFDVVNVAREKILPAPANIKGTHGKYFHGVYHFKEDLIGIIDLDVAIS